MKENLSKIIIVILVLLIALALMFFIKNKESKCINENNTEIVENEENITVEKSLKASRVINEFEVYNFKLEKNDNISKISVNIENISENLVKNKFIYLILVDKEGNELETLKCDIERLEPSESKVFTLETKKDLSKLYSFMALEEEETVKEIEVTNE